MEPLDYTPEKKQTQSTPISPIDVINYCLSSLGATNSGEIYNIHAAIVDKNDHGCAKRTCQPLAIELARMFSSAGSSSPLLLLFCIDGSLVDAGKTGYVTDRKRLHEIRDQHAKKYPDFLEKAQSRSYESKSIVGQLYRNARLYLDGKFQELDRWFAQSIIDEPPRVSSSVGKIDASLHLREILSPSHRLFPLVNP